MTGNRADPPRHYLLTMALLTMVLLTIALLTTMALFMMTDTCSVRRVCRALCSLLGVGVTVPSRTYYGAASYGVAYNAAAYYGAAYNAALLTMPLESRPTSVPPSCMNDVDVVAVRLARPRYKLSGACASGRCAPTARSRRTASARKATVTGIGCASPLSYRSTSRSGAFRARKAAVV